MPKLLLALAAVLTAMAMSVSERVHAHDGRELLRDEYRYIDYCLDMVVDVNFKPYDADATHWCLLHWGSDRFHIEIAESPFAHVSFLRILSRSRSEAVRAAVGRNPLTPLDVLVELAADLSIYVKAAVGENPLTPPRILEELSLNEYPDVREAAGRNIAVSRRVLIRLAFDSVSVREAVASNSATPPEVSPHTRRGRSHQCPGCGTENDGNDGIAGIGIARVNAPVLCPAHACAGHLFAPTARHNTHICHTARNAIFFQWKNPLTQPPRDGAGRRQ